MEKSQLLVATDRNLSFRVNLHAYMAVKWQSLDTGAQILSTIPCNTSNLMLL